uniref:Alpha-L-arabinofuranosidase B catalytic domain-containing protein n=1 Tax=Haptolina ericina TaxID=156174 RepID=A0A7S3BR66_9EUKA|mmetsp:Transcript_66003/g.147320  ORF Transcript_66003/g.147320 Transcript_66003/m.147320 type:complete len:116 (+) Transcript_66003:86-433(+)
MADLENGLWAGDQKVAPAPTINYQYVTAMAKGKKGGFALKGGNGQGGTLRTLHEGARPEGYEQMKKQGAIILGIGGDNSCSAIGTFYEGAMTASYTADATDAAVQANIVAAGYGH